MPSIIPRKLKKGDGVRVIAPAHTLAMPFINPAVRDIATGRMATLGLKVSYGKYVNETDMFQSSSVEHRIEDFHDGLNDRSVHLLHAIIGGFNCNQMLRGLDYPLFRKVCKSLCGFSDITALLNAIYARTGVVTYLGPMFFSFGEKMNFEYTEDHFRRCLVDSEPFAIRPSAKWSNDRWAGKQDERTFNPTEYWVIHPGKAEGRIVGGNLCTFNLLQGTEYFPDLDGTIVLAEDDDTVMPWTFDRDLQSLIHQPGFKDVVGLAIGRFQPGSEMTREKLTYIVDTKPELKDMPVLANMDFGHTTPTATYPIGGEGRLCSETGDPRLEITKH
jgi:muramoyltetrapeptide carboxypeptidase LdcA involved in peptidoglycan recycling